MVQSEKATVLSLDYYHFELVLRSDSSFEYT